MPSVFYQKILKPIFFAFDPHLIHDLILNTGWILGTNPITKSAAKALLRYDNKKLTQTICDLEFDNPVGLSAGFDKDAMTTNILPSVGFGFMSLGTVTLEPYEGNPKPWIYRLKKSKSILVNYGLKNIGVHKIVERIKWYKTFTFRTLAYEKNFKLWVSVGKTNCPNVLTEEQGITDYVECLKVLKASDLADVYEINISCPNTFGGEPFTTPEKLEKLFVEITTLQLGKPILVKMPINLAWEEFKKLLDVLIKYGVSGVIIGNLNKVRSPDVLKDEIPADLKGNLSGLPTQKLSNYLIGETYKYCGNKLKIVGVGGIFSAQDAYEKVKLGASLVELITGMIFEGPQLIGQINKGLVELLEKDGYSNISEAVGKKWSH